MNLNETLALLDALRASGVTKFKSLEHDIEFNGQVTIGQKKIADILEKATAPDPIHSKETADAAAKLKDMISTLNMTPDQMAKHMFPEEVP